jgi:hypothetical protein
VKPTRLERRVAAGWAVLMALCGVVILSTPAAAGDGLTHREVESACTGATQFNNTSYSNGAGRFSDATTAVMRCSVSLAADAVVRLYGGHDGNDRSFTVTIDGGVPIEVRPNKSADGTVRFQQLVWTSATLPAGTRVLDIARHSGATHAVAFDFFTVQEKAADTSPPTAPGSFAAAGSGEDVALTWTASTDDVGVADYELTIDGGTPVLIAGTATSYLHAAGASADHSYSLVARDAAGNRSTASTASYAAPTTTTTDTTTTAEFEPMSADVAVGGLVEILLAFVVLFGVLVVVLGLLREVAS